MAGVVAIYRAIDNAIPRDVYTLCRECGIDDVEIDWLIDGARHAKASRATLRAAFDATFEDRRNIDLCAPCAEAVLDAAGK